MVLQGEHERRVRRGAADLAVAQEERDGEIEPACGTRNVKYREITAFFATGPYRWIKIPNDATNAEYIRYMVYIEKIFCCFFVYPSNSN